MIAEPAFLDVIEADLDTGSRLPIELIIGSARRRVWTAREKLSIIEESLATGETISLVARRHGGAPNLLYRWRCLTNEGGAMAVGSYEPVVGSSELRKLKDRVRELERLLGCKTMEVEILREALAKADSKNRSCGRCCCRRAVPGEAHSRSAGRVAL